MEFKYILSRKRPFSRFMHSLCKNENIPMWKRNCFPPYPDYLKRSILTYCYRPNHTSVREPHNAIVLYSLIASSSLSSFENSKDVDFLLRFLKVGFTRDEFRVGVVIRGVECYNLMKIKQLSCL